MVVCNNLNTSIKDPIIKYTGNCSYSIVDGSEWRLKLLTSGTLTVTTKTQIDAFLVGGGGGGSCCNCETKHGGSGGKTTTFNTTL